jgi:AmmeMemoRadiSam system protein A
MLNQADGLALCRYARACIRTALGGPPARPPDGSQFHFDGACFVTLYRGEELHGCIGSLEAHQPLLTDVADNSVSAALRDPRNTPLDLGDEQTLRVEVSLLSPLTRLAVRSRAEAIAALRPGKDGVVLRYHGRRGTFLPQVWEELPEPPEFWRHLLRKAGLPTDFDSPELEVYRYTVDKWIEEPQSP